MQTIFTERETGHERAAALALPAAWVTAEYLISVASPHGTFASLAYTQVDFLLALQLASASGLWGIDFVVLLVPSAPAATSSATVGLAGVDEPASPISASDERARRALDAYAREVDALSGRTRIRR